MRERGGEGEVERGGEGEKEGRGGRGGRERWGGRERGKKERSNINMAKSSSNYTFTACYPQQNQIRTWREGSLCIGISSTASTQLRELCTSVYIRTHTHTPFHSQYTIAACFDIFSSFVEVSLSKLSLSTTM